jgi:uncharacterized protein YdhG (YjbR/CyaY superfamily)
LFFRSLYYRAVSKPSSRERRSSARPGAQLGTVDQYLAAVPEPARSTLNRVRATIRSVLPKDATEVISYRIPAFKHKRIVVWYAAFSDHCSLFPTGSVIARFKDELKGYKISKGTIQFPIAKPLPAALLKKIVRARLVDIE